MWTRENIEELLASILQGYFIGTFLILDTPPEQAIFPFWTVEGLDAVKPDGKPGNHATVRLVLDGQQRITSLFYIDHEKDHFETLWGKACASLAKAYQRVILPAGYGEVAERWIPYSTLLVPLAVLLQVAEEKQVGEAIYRKVDRWYWGNVFAQRYDQAVDTTSYRDVREMKDASNSSKPP